MNFTQEFTLIHPFRFTLGGKQLYIETILQDDDPDDPTIQIVSIHDA